MSSILKLKVKLHVKLKVKLEENAVKGRRGSGGVLEKVMSILQEDEGRGREDVNEEGTEWT